MKNKKNSFKRKNKNEPYYVWLSENAIIFDDLIRETKKAFYERNETMEKKAKWFYFKKKLSDFLEKTE